MRFLIDGRHLTRPRLSGGARQTNGVGEYTAQILRALFLLDRTNEYVVLTTGRTVSSGNHGELPLHPFPKNVARVHVPIPNRLLTLSMALRERPCLDELAGGHFDAAFFPNLAIGRVSPGLPYVLTSHDLSWKILPDCYSWRMRLWHRLAKPESLVQGAATVLVPSTHARREILRAFGLDTTKVRAIPHGLRGGFGPHPEATDHGVRSRHRLPKRFVLFVGTLEPRKNLLAAIDAVAAYRRETHDDLHFVLAGGWGWNTFALRAKLAAPDIRSFVHHLGPVPADDLPGLYRLAASLLWPSLYEGFGLPVLEAMASGTPVITSHTSSLPELTAGAAILVNPYDANEITAALRELLGSPILAGHLKTAGLRRAADFSWETAAQALHESLLRAGGG